MRQPLIQIGKKVHTVLERTQETVSIKGTCLITKKSIVVEKIPLKGIEKYNSGELIQNAFPEMSEDHREFLISGVSGKAFDKLFADDN